jgi:hypothetical protein
MDKVAAILVAAAELVTAEIVIIVIQKVATRTVDVKDRVIDHETVMMMNAEVIIIGVHRIGTFLNMARLVISSRIITSRIADFQDSNSQVV